ncbi:hypothetical protein SmJEL517_g04571 [Synchytrium microbalum]|uniref:Phosphatidic acid phosphatase type 2/haloperoxidase domain-containing protein n=1 Tax=Synchytrium microbalum TaxID=1806994 RepID=A0A507BXX3_9FUNG|nr:uncharacterized protein SmJEL517_g04571 [Synchytrium microbalum]TPX32282.1 hypothetical protein SmJEL517_g04571 [Synchytrium microbalum]
MASNSTTNPKQPLLGRTPPEIGRHTPSSIIDAISPRLLPQRPSSRTDTYRQTTYFPPPTEAAEQPRSLLTDLFPWWSFFYIVDFLVAAALWGLTTWTSSFQPYLREINLLDPDITRPFHAGDIVPMKLVAFLTVFVPMTCCIAYHALLLVSRWGHDYYRSDSRVIRKYLARESLAYLLHDFHHAALSLLLATGATKVVTDTLKAWMGRFRPDFLDRCDMDLIAMVCTGDPKIVRDGRESFPSGHSSSSFVGMGWVSLYLAGKLSAWCLDEKPNDGRVLSMILCVCPLMWAAYVAISRTEENKHHPTDVLAGSLLGLTIAYISYRMFYPNVFSGDRRAMKRPKGFTDEGEYDGLGGEYMYSTV